MFFPRLRLFLVLAGSVLFMQAASAQGYIANQLGAFAGPQGAGYDAPDDPRILVARWIARALSVLAVIFLTYTVYAALLLATSGGDEEKVNKAKSTIRTGVLGVIIVIASYSITTLVSNAILASYAPESNIIDGLNVEAGIDFETDTNLNNGLNRDPLNIPQQW